MEPDNQLMEKFMKKVGKRVDLEKLKKLHEKYPNTPWYLLRRPNGSDSMLHAACRYGQTDVVRYMIETYKPGVYECIARNFKTPLHEAAQFGHPEIAEILLNGGACVDALKFGDWTPLMLACTKIRDRFSTKSRNARKLIEILLKHGASINFRNKDGWTVLHIVAREGNVEVLKLLEAYNLEFDQATKNGRTALHIAALHGHEEMVKELLKHDCCNVDAVDYCGNRPIHDSALGGHLPVFILLLNKSSRTLIRNTNGYTVLHLAASRGRMDILRYLVLELKVDCNIQVKKELFTALHCAARSYELEAYTFLIANGCHLGMPDAYGRIASEYMTNWEEHANDLARNVIET